MLNFQLPLPLFFFFNAVNLCSLYAFISGIFLSAPTQASPKMYSSSGSYAFIFSLSQIIALPRLWFSAHSTPTLLLSPQDSDCNLYYVRVRSLSRRCCEHHEPPFQWFCLRNVLSACFHRSGVSFPPWFSNAERKDGQVERSHGLDQFWRISSADSVCSPFILPSTLNI